MENAYEFKLVQGDFSPAEAEKVLLSLLQNKISYHNMEALSTQIRFGGDVSRSERRIRELEQIRQSLTAFLTEAGHQDTMLVIEGTFTLKVLNQEGKNPN
jgi:flagellar biosynthesis component FlhA